MLKKSVVSIVTFASVFLSVVGCSNNISPLSVSKTPEKTTASIKDKELYDICVVGNLIWGLSRERVGTTNNYWIYYYDNRGQIWVKSNHYGKKIAVSTNNRCYHINAENQIWWGTTTSNGQIPLPPNQVQVLDIGVGNSAAGQSLMVICKDASGAASAWKFWLEGNTHNIWAKLVAVPENPIAVSVDPYNGYNAAYICGSDNRVYVCGERSLYYLQVNSPTSCTNVSICGTNVICNTKGGKYIYKATVGGTYSMVSSLGSTWGLTADKYYYYMFSGSDKKVDKMSY